MAEANDTEFSAWSGRHAVVMPQCGDSERLMIRLSTAAEDGEPHTVLLSTCKTWWISCRLGCYEILCSPADIASKMQGCRILARKRVFVNNNNNNKKEGGRRVDACVPTTDSQVAIERDGEVVPELFWWFSSAAVPTAADWKEGDAAFRFTVTNNHVVVEKAWHLV